MTKVVHCKKEPYDFYGGRPSFLGNPIKVGDSLPDGSLVTRDFAINWYREYFLEKVKIDKEFRKKVLALKGKIISCWCAPKPCHLDIVAEWLEKNEKGE